jgi:hypothetical protein
LGGQAIFFAVFRRLLRRNEVTHLFKQAESFNIYVIASSNFEIRVPKGGSSQGREVNVRIIFIFSVVSLFFASSPAFAITTQTNLGMGADIDNKLIGGKTTVFVKGQYAAEILRILRLNLAVELSKPHSIFWFEGEANAQLYPLNFFVPKEFRYLPYLSAGAITRQRLDVRRP